MQVGHEALRKAWTFRDIRPRGEALKFFREAADKSGERRREPVTLTGRTRLSRGPRLSLYFAPGPENREFKGDILSVPFFIP